MHNLTLAELNKTTNIVSGSTRENVTEKEGFKDLTGTALGIFDMIKLEGYTKYMYWLASAGNSSNYLELVSSDYSNVIGSNNYTIGVRPVITLSSSVKLIDTNNDGILEIQ